MADTQESRLSIPLTEPPSGPLRTFLDFPFLGDLDALQADFAVLGVPFGMPYSPATMANDQSRAPDALRQAAEDASYTRAHFDWDLGGPLFDGRDVTLVDCGNVTADRADHREHYRRAEAAARKIFAAGTLHAGDLLCADAEAIFVSAQREKFQELLAERDRYEAEKSS